MGAAGETPTMGVVVESRTDANSTFRLARWFSLGTCVGVASCGNGAAAPQGVIPQIQRPVRGLGRTFGLRSLRRTESALWRGPSKAFLREQVLAGQRGRADDMDEFSRA